MWVARDKNGELYLYTDLPKRMGVNWSGECIGGFSSQKYFAETNVIDYITGYETLKWEDEPIEVSIVCTDYLKDLEKIMDMYEEEHCSIDTNKLNNMLGEALDKETADTYNKKYD